MQEYLAAGVLLGAAAGLAPGPMLTLVISESLRHGAGAGMRVALAPLITDLPIILVTLLLLGSLSGYEPLLGLLSLAGGVIVLYLAWETLRPPAVNLAAAAPRSLRKGVITNFLNPHPYLFWLGVGGPLLLRAREQAGWSAPAAFLLLFYLLLVGSKLLLAWLTGRSRGFLQGRAYRWTLRGLGALLALFGVLLLRDGLVLLGLGG